MPRHLDDPGWAEVQRKVAEALAPFAPLFGARQCPHEDDWSDCDSEECGFENTQPRPNSMPVIQHFLLLTATTDMAQSGNEPAVLVAIDSVSQPGYASRGLANDYLFN